MRRSKFRTSRNFFWCTDGTVPPLRRGPSSRYIARVPAVSSRDTEEVCAVRGWVLRHPPYGGATVQASSVAAALLTGVLFSTVICVLRKRRLRACVCVFVYVCNVKRRSRRCAAPKFGGQEPPAPTGWAGHETEWGNCGPRTRLFVNVSPPLLLRERRESKDLGLCERRWGSQLREERESLGKCVTVRRGGEG
ncbi:hypothetical protein HPB51_014272 [Rhipicephalus microplus]|uniref:Uncharacterized protein n=1 Tax=Rhipicephalus microplus TaxID=6941 RepID=A0A9J6DUS8_RHIMP|nr:hypothetical protein HPB51_014272 [Rhipicephalus microplus]